MLKYGFQNDYSEGAHPNIIKALTETNHSQEECYGKDQFSEKAALLIQKKIGNSNVDVHFTLSGTQTNLVVISSILRPIEAVIAAKTAHINVHETGAVEATGHKILLIDSKNGKLTPKDIEPILKKHSDEHMVKPKLVFISNATELGTIYNKKELEELHSFCKSNNLYLYLDGARLSTALTAKNNNLSLKDISKLVDVFYIGGTKSGAFIGEALIIVNKELRSNFRYYLKQRGGLIAKSRLIGLQFIELFKDDLFFELGRHANLMASKLAHGIEREGYSFLTSPESNQIFPIFSNKFIDKLKEKYGFYVWAKSGNDKSAIRLVTSWATKEEFVDKFLLDLKNNHSKQ